MDEKDNIMCKGIWYGEITKGITKDELLNEINNEKNEKKKEFY